MVIMALIVGGQWERVEIGVKRVRFWASPSSSLGLQNSAAAAASPCCSAPGRFRSPLGPLARRPGPADTPSARPDPMQGPGAPLPPGCPPLQHVPGSGGLRLGCRASRASVGRGGSPADALCGKRLRLPALRSWSWTAPSGGRSGRFRRWP